MRVYHFVNKKYGIEDLKRRRLKVATLNELNDPFEFFGIDLSDPLRRHAFRKMKADLSVTQGLLCFSRDWHNPVQWSHYADKHQGICLGFDVPDDKLGPINYSRKPLVVETKQLLAFRQLDQKTVIKFLFTKYTHWRYENEVRGFVTLEEMDPEKNMYFANFSEELKLAQVIVGAESTLTRADVRDALGDLVSVVETFKTRLAFKSFRVVRQRNPKLWD